MQANIAWLSVNVVRPKEQWPCRQTAGPDTAAPDTKENTASSPGNSEQVATDGYSAAHWDIH